MPLYLAGHDKADLIEHLNNGDVNMLILNGDAKVVYLCTKHPIVWVHKYADCVQTKNMQEFSVDISRWTRHTFKEHRIGDKAEAMSKTTHNPMAVQGW